MRVFQFHYATHNCTYPRGDDSYERVPHSRPQTQRVVVAIRNIHLNPPDRGSGRVLPSSRPAKASDPGSFQSSIARGPRPSHLTFGNLLERKGLPSYIEAIALRAIAARAMEICRRRPVTPPR
jgi:hypothetical protein